MRVAVVVLAAGSSTRFGKPKQFGLFQGETFIKRIVAAAIAAGCAPVVVVTGEDSTQVTLELTGLSVSIAMNQVGRVGWHRRLVWVSNARWISQPILMRRCY